jgi:hypothetical protein
MSANCSDTLLAPPSIVGDGVAAPLAPGLLSPRLLPKRLRPPKAKPRLSAVPFPIRYAAVCRAVAAADRRAKCDLAFASFVAQSGRTLSVVMTVEAFAEIEVVRLLCVCGCGDSAGLVVELSEDEDDIADAKAPRPWFAFA